MIKRPAVAAAETVDRNKKLETFARFGYVVNGLFHALIGISAIGIVIGQGGEVDQSGVLKPMTTTIWGMLFVLLIALGLIALSFWKVMQILISTKLQRKGLRRYAFEEGVKALAYVVLGVSTLILLFSHSAQDSSARSSRQLVANLYGIPLGPLLVLLLGIGCMAIGVSLIYKGVRRRFMRILDGPPEKLEPLVIVLGTVGYISKGLILLSLGVIFGFTFFARDPSRVSGLDGAFRDFLSLPFGGIVIVALGVGFIFYALFSITRAKIGHIRIKTHKYI